MIFITFARYAAKRNKGQKKNFFSNLQNLLQKEVKVRKEKIFFNYLQKLLQYEVKPFLIFIFARIAAKRIRSGEEKIISYL